MGMMQKRQYQKVMALCLMLVCFVSGGSAQSAQAASAAQPVILTVDQSFTKPESSTAAGEFTYTMTALQPGDPMPVGSSGDVLTFTIDGTKEEPLGAISYTRPGTYGYEIRQTIASQETGCTYDTQVYTVTIYVDSYLSADVIIQKEDSLEKVEKIVFENGYAPLASDPTIMVDPPVKKTVSGSPSKKGTFTFKLEAGDKNNPMPTGSKDGVKLMTIIGPGEEDFGTWSYIKAGTYFYTISEVNVGEADYTYDTMVYTITDTVKDVDGQLEVSRTVTNASNKPVGSYDFINKYTGNDHSGSTNKGGSTGIGSYGPKTGDDTIIWPYQILMGISGLFAIGCILFLIISRKHREKKANIN